MITIDKKQAEIEKILLQHEKEAFKDLKNAYNQAQKDIEARILKLQNSLNELNAISTIGMDEEKLKILESMKQSKIYQIKYQEMLDKQINSCIDILKQDTVTNISSYLYKVYEDSYLGNLYNINAKGIPVTTPINPSLLVEVVNQPTGDMQYSKFGRITKTDKDGLTYVQRVERNMNDFKKKVKAEISRGIANGSTYKEISNMLSMVTGEDIHVSERIVRTEGTRVSSKARLTSMRDAKEKGADIVRQWDSTLDGKTRPLHIRLDQQIAEIDKPFKVDGIEVEGPGLFGDPAEDCNCRCVLLSVPRWDIEDSKIRYDNENDVLIETNNYNDWKQGYYRRISDKELFNKATLEELKEMASSYKIKNYNKMKKAELVEMIVNKMFEEGGKQ